MSVQQMSLVWGLDLPSNQKLVLLAYADHADDDGEHVYPSLGRVAHKTGYSRDQVRRITRDLEDAELMASVEHKDPDKNKPKRWRLTLEGGSKLPPFEARKGGSNMQRGGGKQPSPPGANDPPGAGAPVPPEPSVEPSVEPSESAREKNGPPKLAYLDDETRRTVETLLSVKGWDRSEARTVELVAEVGKTYPGLDALSTATSLAFKIRTGAVHPYKKPSRAFANWVASDAERASIGFGDAETPRRRKKSL